MRQRQRAVLAQQLGGSPCRCLTLRAEIDCHQRSAGQAAQAARDGEHRHVDVRENLEYGLASEQAIDRCVPANG